jgi:hypothetical protein
MTARMTPRQCDLVLTASQKFVAVAPIFLFLAIPLIAIAVFREVDGIAGERLPPFFPWFPVALFVVLAVVFAWTIASIPYRLTVTHDQQLEFKSMLHVRRVRAANVLSIKPRSLHIQANVSGYELAHRDGKIRFPGQFDGFHVVLHELKLVNPSVQIKGC